MSLLFLFDFDTPVSPPPITKHYVKTEDGGHVLTEGAFDVLTEDSTEV